MQRRLILDRWRWREVRDFVRRTRIPATASVRHRADDYVAVADAFGLVWPQDDRRRLALLRGFGDPNPRAVSATMDRVVAPVVLRPTVRAWIRAVD